MINNNSLNALAKLNLPAKFNMAAKLSAVVIAIALSACSPSDSNRAVNTGDADYETNYGVLSDKQAVNDAVVYVSSPRLNIRSQPNTDAESIVGSVVMNDVLRIVDNRTIGDQNFIAVRIVKSGSPLDKGTIYYTSKNFLNSTAVVVAKENLDAQKIFVVTNIATEKVRVYKRCEATENCVNKLMFEQDVVVGEDDDGTKTDVGHYRITNWEKFYETPGVYPAWYKSGYPQVPKPNSSMSSWFDRSYMPGGQGSMRGAFGWYTAKVGPNPNGQWMHGTAGWGQDKQNFILFKNSFMGAITNIFKAIRSHGCTRIDNESIAYLRNIVPVGATYIKIYAKEAYRNEKMGVSTKTGAWPYIMTKNQNETADRNSVMQNGTAESAIIEQGTLSFLETATAVSENSKGSDVYRIGSSAFNGHFIVDEGTVVNYQHPRELQVGGYTDRQLPNFMLSSNDQVYVPKPVQTSVGPGQGGKGLITGH